MNVPKSVHKLTGLEPHHLCHHHGQEAVRSDVEWHAQKSVRTALVQLAIQFAFCHMELEQTMARRQGHVVDETGVPRADDVSPAVGIGLQLFDQLGDLVGVRAIRIGPRPPLVAIDRAQIALRVRPVVPNPDAIVLQVLDVGVPLKEPKQLMDDGPEVEFLGGQHWKALAQVKPHLVTKTPQSASPRAVFAFHPFVQKVIQ